MDFVILKGWGYQDCEGRFIRAVTNIPVRLAPTEYAKPGHSIVYTTDDRRLHVDKRALLAYHEAQSKRE